MKKNKSVLTGAWHILKEIAQRRPWRLALIFIGRLVSSLLENIGILALLPLLNLLIEKDSGQTSQISQQIKQIYDYFGIPFELGPLLIVIVLIIVFKSLVAALINLYASFTTFQVSRELRRTLMGHILRANWRFHLNQPSGKSGNMLTGELTNYTNAITNAISLITSGVQTTIYLVTATLFSWKLTLAAILLGLFIMVILVPALMAVRAASHDITNHLNAVSSRMVEALQGIKALKSMGREAHVLSLLERENDKLYAAQRRTVIALTIRSYLPEPTSIIALSIGLYLSIEIFGAQIASLALFIILFRRIMNEVLNLNKIVHAIGTTEGSVTIIRDEIKKAAAEAEKLHGGTAPQMSQDGITLDNIYLSYDNKKVLKGVSAKIPPEKLTVLLGPSGSGKTSLIDAIVGFVNPDKGEIMIGDKSIDKINLHTWRQMIGYVPQELFLFHDTIYENIALGDKSISRKDVIEALKNAEAIDFINELPGGLDTMVGERGMKLSGGQRQRLSIARALVRRPQLLLLDEATSALDTKTEEEICKTLEKLAKTVTIIAVTHQQAIRNVADQVLEICDGKIQSSQSSTPKISHSA